MVLRQLVSSPTTATIRLGLQSTSPSFSMELAWASNASLISLGNNKSLISFREKVLYSNAIFLRKRNKKCFNRRSWLLNPEVDPSHYEDIRCPCYLGIATCPANASQQELYRYASMTSDEFYDLTHRDIDLWLIRTHKTLKKQRYD